MRRLLIVVLLAGAALRAGTALAQPPGTNYDEAKIPAYTLPDLLVMGGGESVNTPADWAKRRAELRSLLETRMFGRAPARPGRMAFDVTSVDKAALGGLAVRKEVAISVDGSASSTQVSLPVTRTSPAFSSVRTGDSVQPTAPNTPLMLSR